MPERLPVVWFSKRGKMLIRGTEDALLCWFLKTWHQSRGHSYLRYLGNDDTTALAVATEATHRPDITGPALFWANRLIAPNCRCGRPGLYIVGATTYCRACVTPALRSRADRKNRQMDARGGEIHALRRERTEHGMDIWRHENRRPKR